MPINNSSFQLIKELMDLQATSGAEDQVREYLKKNIHDKVDELVTDGLGSLFGVKHAKKKDAPVVMVAAHMDEVGFMVESIKSNGLLSVVSLGGWNMQVVSAQRFTLQTEQGDFPVVSSSVPPHLLKDKNQTPELSQLSFDGGFSSKEEAESFGVRPGDAIVPDAETIPMANSSRVLGKAFDNRYGVAMVIDLLRNLANVDLDYTLVAGATVQEEVGLRGAKSAVELIKPDFFIAVDASPANDISGSKEAMGQLGEGFLVRVQDPGMLTPRKIIRWMVGLAEEHKINYQYYFAKGGTDAVAAQVGHTGIPSCVIGCPARYIHTHQSIFDMKDYESAKEIILTVIKDLNKNKIKEFQTF